MVQLDELDKYLSEVAQKLEILEKRSYVDGNNDDQKNFGLLPYVYMPESSKPISLHAGTGESGGDEEAGHAI